MNDRFQNFTFSIMKLNKLVNRIKLIEMKEFGLKGIHVLCIYDLFVQGAMTAGELSRVTLEDKAAISRALKLLAGGTLTEEQRSNFYECLDIISSRLEAYYKCISGGENE